MFTSRQMKFIEYMARNLDANPKDAARYAGYAGIDTEANRQMQNPRIVDAIERCRRGDPIVALDDKPLDDNETDISGEASEAFVLKRLRSLAVRCSIPGKTWNPSASIRALELIGKHLGMFVDRQEVNVNVGLADQLREARKRAGIEVVEVSALPEGGDGGVSQTMKAEGAGR